MELKIYDPYKRNSTVTRAYISTIADSFKRIGYDVKFVDTLITKKVKSSVLVIAAKDAIKAKKLGYDKIFFWVQGIVPEESYMRHSSKIRYSILNRIEKRALESSDFLFYVSNAMREHYLKKYCFDSNKNYVMPCFNSEIDKEGFNRKKKYKRNLFLYAGGLEPWQCFETTLALYKKVEDIIPTSELRVLTREQSLAEEILKKYDIKRFSIDFKNSNEMNEEMGKAKFGFSLREEHPVNFVSTPTKLSTYISYGVIPIYSKNIIDFSRLAKDKCFMIRADEDNEYGIERIIKLCNEDIDAESVYAEFSETFKEYYNREYHIKHISQIVRNEVGNGDI